MQSLRTDAEADRFVAGDDGEGSEAGETAGDSPGLGTESLSTLPPVASQSKLALADIVQGARARYVWGLLGWQDIRRRYRRSILGPFWLTISMGILVAALGALYGTLLNVEIAVYVPFLALGFVIWTLISAVITEGCTAFISAESIVKQTNLPLSVHVYRMVWRVEIAVYVPFLALGFVIWTLISAVITEGCTAFISAESIVKQTNLPLSVHVTAWYRNFLILCHNAAIFVVVAVVFAIWPGWTGLLALPGLVILCLNAIWVGLLLGIVSARFRDVPPIVASVVRILFFVTPIIWMPELMPARALMLALVLDFNPFFHFVEVVRAPLLGQAPALVSWLAVSGITLGGWLLAFALMVRYRRRIAYWV